MGWHLGSVSRFGEIRLIFTVSGANFKRFNSFGKNVSNFGRIFAVGQIIFVVNDQILNRKM